MGTFFHFGDSDDGSGSSGVRWWFSHLFGHLAIPFILLASLARDTVKKYFQRSAAPELTSADKDVAALFSEIHGDTKAMEAFLEKENFSPTMQHWLVIAGLDPMTALDGDSPREAQIKFVVRECRPACYRGDFCVVDGDKLKEFLLTEKARQKLDDDFYMQLLVRVSHLAHPTPRVLQ